MQESAGTTELSKSVYNYHWLIKNFDVICPPQSKEFDQMKSPLFTAGDEIGKKSRWFIHITGIAEHIACYLQLDTGTEGRNHRTQSVTTSFKIGFGNKDDRFHFSRSIAPHKFTRDQNDWGYAKFCPISDLYENKDVYLKDNTFHVSVQMEIFGDPINTTTPLTFKRKRESTLEKFSTDFKSLLNPNKYFDVDIRCGSTLFHGHKLILAARSSVFRAMFESEMTESADNEVVIEDIEPHIFTEILNYIYTGKLEVPDSFPFPDLIYGAEKYDLVELKHACFDKLLYHVSNETVGVLAVAAHTYNADPETKKIVKEYCQTNIKTLMQLPSFKELLIKHSRAFFED